ncbi:MAG: T9SS type A sorting domain-containing protein [Bacteroidota bacterium]
MKALLFFLVFMVLYNAQGQTTQLAASFCPGTLSNISSNITCTANLGQGHRFEVRKMDNTLVGVYDGVAANLIYPSRSKYIFRFTWMSGCGIDYGTTYRIAVSWYNGTSWSPYGSQCQVTTPSNTLQVKSTLCNTTVAGMGSSITTNVNRMCGHRFEVRLTDETPVDVYDAYAGAQANPGRSAYEFRFSWLTGTIQYSTTYRIRVAYFDASTSTWSAYGPYCDISTPDLPLTQLTTAWCNNSNVATSSTNIYCDVVAGTYQYQFSISAPGYGPITNLVKTTNSFKLSELPAPHPLAGLQYDVLVSTRQVTTDPFGPAGNQCFVKLSVPTTVISNNDCGTTVNYLQQDTIHALPISGAQGYRFRIVAGATTILDTVTNLTSYNGITLRKFPGVQYCITYSMSVRVLMNGTWSNWGSACNVSTTCSPTTELRPAFITNPTIESCATNIYVNSVIYATNYEYSVTSGAINDIFQSVSSGFKLSQIPSASSVKYETSYNVSCRVFVNGVWQPWGPINSIFLSKQSQLTGYCNALVPTMGSNVYCGSVGCATDYRFKLTGPGLSGYVHNPSTMTNRFQPSQLLGAGIQYNQIYSVEVAYLAGGVWSVYGPPCNITTPSALMPNPTIDYVEDNLVDDGGDINAQESISGINEERTETIEIYPNPSRNSFLLKFNNSNGLTYPMSFIVTDFSGKVMEEILVRGDVEQSFGEQLPSGIFLVSRKNDLIYKPLKIIKL